MREISLKKIACKKNAPHEPTLRASSSSIPRIQNRPIVKFKYQNKKRLNSMFVFLKSSTEEKKQNPVS